MKYFLYYLIAINLITFFAFGIDKRKAEKGAWRTKESTLLGLAAIGGSVGALLGMNAFRHKTKHKKIHHRRARNSHPAGSTDGVVVLF